MQRRLNFRFLAWMVASVAVLSVCVHIVHSVQMQQTARSPLRQAERALQQKDYGRAAALFQYYLEHEPDDTGALANYVRAMEQGPSSSQTRLKTFLLLEQLLRRQP